jgi:aspartyl protease family protein
MTGDDGFRVLMALLMLVLVGSALVSRRLAPGQVVKMALAWIAIFGLGFVVFMFKDDVKSRFFSALDPDAGQSVGGSLRVPMAEDGHFWVRGQVDGAEVRFLIDSGATTNALSKAVIDAAGIVPGTMTMPVAIETANGTVMAQRVHIGRLELGGIVRTDMAAVSAPEFGDMNVLGMNFLSSLSGWNVEGRTLILRP